MVMSESLSFEELHQASHERLVLQAIALTGDPSAAAAGVRDAFLAASRNWNKVSRFADPEEWVRNRAWSMTHRRHLAKPWHRDQEITSEQATVLRGLQQLSDNQRRCLLLHELADLSMPAICRELGITETQASKLLHQAEQSFARAVGNQPAQTKETLQLLEPLAAGIEVPDPADLQKAGRRHQAIYTVVGSVAAISVFLGAGFLVSSGTAGPVLGSDPDTIPVTQSMLLSEQQLQPLAPAQRWAINSTSDNTEGTGLNTICQTERFADSTGVGAFVRKFSSLGIPAKTLVESVEVSKSSTEAKAAYKATREWYAGCKAPRLRLVSTWQVSGLGDEAEVMSFEIPGVGKKSNSLMVALARSGSLTLSTAEATENGTSVSPEMTTQVLTNALSRLCKSTAGEGKCDLNPELAATNPPLSGEPQGSLSVVDLPAVGEIQFPWLGSDLLSGEPNVASTPCDATSFSKAGATQANTRSYFIPQSGLPTRFGITETFAKMPNQNAADKVINGVFTKMESCEKDRLGSKVSQPRIQRKGPDGSSYGLWRVESQINDQQETIQAWMGIARVGTFLAQVNFTPAGANDLDQAQFNVLMQRALTRLKELTPVEPSPAPQSEQEPEPAPQNKSGTKIEE